MSERVWVVLDRKVSGNTTRWVPLLGTVARTRAGAVALYERNTDRTWIATTYADDKKNGYVRCEPRALTPDQPKSKAKRTAK